MPKLAAVAKLVTEYMAVNNVNEQKNKNGVAFERAVRLSRKTRAACVVCFCSFCLVQFAGPEAVDQHLNDPAECDRKVNERIQEK